MMFFFEIPKPEILYLYDLNSYKVKSDKHVSKLHIDYSLGPKKNVILGILGQIIKEVK
jgi:hypothetical protein